MVILTASRIITKKNVLKDGDESRKII